MSQHGRKLRVAGIAVSAIAIAAMVLRTLSKYLAGDGIESYRNVKGALLNYASALVTFGVLALCIVAAYVARWWHYRQERRLEEIVRARANATNTVDEKSRN